MLLLIVVNYSITFMIYSLSVIILQVLLVWLRIYESVKSILKSKIWVCRPLITMYCCPTLYQMADCKPCTVD